MGSHVKKVDMEQESGDVWIIRQEKGQKFSVLDLLYKAGVLLFSQERLRDLYI